MLDCSSMKRERESRVPDKLLSSLYNKQIVKLFSELNLHNAILDWHTVYMYMKVVMRASGKISN